VQIGPGIEVSMRSNMMNSQLDVSNLTLRSAAATRGAKPGILSSLRAWTGSALHFAGASLAGREADSTIGNCSTVICAS
jgi:hypothetical protein